MKVTYLRAGLKKIPGLFLAVTGLFFQCAPMQAENVTVTVETQNPGIAIPPDFTGLSFEAALLLPNPDGVRYFRPDNAPLVHLFHTLGIKHLRIGGNTSDRNVKQMPGEADIDSVFNFAKAAGVKVLYCLRLHDGDPQADAKTAKHIMDNYDALLDSFSIGQEPSAYPKVTAPDGTQVKYPYASYRDEWKKFADAIVAAVSNVRFCGPSVENNPEWARRFVADFGRGYHVALITEHLYPGGSGNKVPTPEIGRDRMLSGDFVKAYQRLYDGFVPAAVSNALPYRLEELNNYFNGGATNVSNTHASALWGLDCMYWWVEHKAAGLDFHSGDSVAAGPNLRPSRYTAYYTASNGYQVRPLGYGLKAFDLGSHGQLVPAKVANPGNINLSAYAVLAEGKTTYLTLINKEHGANPRDATVNIQSDGGQTSGEVIYLSAPGNDIAATNGITLGGAEIQNDASWNGKWQPLDAPTGTAPATFAVKVPAATAAVVKLSIK